MAEINDLLYQLRLADQSTTQLFEKRLGISLTRYQILQYLLEQAPCNQIAVQERLTDMAYNRLVNRPPRHHLAVKDQMSRILTAQEQEQFSYLLDKLVSGIEQITVE